MKTQRFVTLALLAAGALAATGTARADEAGTAAQAARADIQKTLGSLPRFFRAFPEEALPGAWMEMKTLQLNPSTALSGQVKELIGLAVASQIPCRYCTFAHTEFAKLNGASERAVGEAIAMAGLTRHWSTFLNGMQLDEGKFRGEINQLVAGAKKATAAPKPEPAKPIAVTDAASAEEDMRRTLGMAPEFLRRFPAEALAGVWTEFKGVQLNPKTALSGKNKELIGLAVAAQVPCRYCVYAHAEFARLNGASEREITEAIAMASLTRNLSTLLNGSQADESAFKQDIERVIADVKRSAAAQASAQRQGRTPAR